MFTVNAEKSFRHGATGWVASLQHQDASSIPGSAQWVKGSGWAWILAGELHLPWRGQKRKKRERKKEKERSSRRGSVLTNPTRIHEGGGSIPGLAQGAKDPVLPRAVA